MASARSRCPQGAARRGTLHPSTAVGRRWSVSGKQLVFVVVALLVVLSLVLTLLPRPGL